MMPLFIESQKESQKIGFVLINNEDRFNINKPKHN